MVGKHGYIEAICISPQKGMVKMEVPQALLETDWGIQGDAHAGVWHRQISLLAGESIDCVRKRLPGIRHGIFAENIVTRNIDFTELAVGDTLCIGEDVVLEVTKIGKKCHNDGCIIKKKTGDCIMPREGVFCRVIKGGTLTPGKSCTLCGPHREKCTNNHNTEETGNEDQTT